MLQANQWFLDDRSSESNKINQTLSDHHKEKGRNFIRQQSREGKTRNINMYV